MPVCLNGVLEKRVRVLKALAHPSRLVMTQTLMKRPHCVQELRNLVGDDFSTVSKHLAVLRRAGVVVREKQGQSVFYSLTCNCFGTFLECIDDLCPTPPKRPRKTPVPNRSMSL
jgi:ArsR family transcriptional regulator